MGEFYDRIDFMGDQGRLLCVGLDPRPGRLPGDLDAMEPSAGYFTFMSNVIDSVADIAGAVKPNKAFYLGLDRELGGAGRGIELFQRVIKHSKENHPDLIVICDSKDADIGPTNEPYAAAAFDFADADAITTNPYFGYETSEPFLSREDRGVIPMVRTLNPDSDLLQLMPTRISDLAKQFNRSGIRVYTDEQLSKLSDIFEGGDVIPLYAAVASQIRHSWNYNGNCGVVAGATHIEELRKVRLIVGDRIPILIPGVGKQGGEAEEAGFNGANSSGRGILVNESSSIIFASSGADFAARARERALESSELINIGASARAIST